MDVFQKKEHPVLCQTISFFLILETEWEVGDAALQEGRVPLIGSIVLLSALGPRVPLGFD